ncbi:hypothetical protein BDV40DRAFT_311437 [Aspergillus tamarii]|uniref:Aconitase A/isopropylmalate dehydratase small subunit swivel domain-containing protein n=1 Tax=Aspergillus tamarii TaxID=41984 RepID=A0A5N6VAT9_ASPTM|nr:hypothetical protein BDV40DRAFT_311437 [Aspergillus tamarii]
MSRKRMTGLNSPYQILEDHTENGISDEPIEEASSSSICVIKNLKIAQNTLRGHGLTEYADLTEEQESEVLFLVARPFHAPLPTRPEGQRGMTLSEKIFSLYGIGQRGSVAPGDLIRVDLVGDHVVDPRVDSLPKVQVLVDASERAKAKCVFKLTNYQVINELGSIVGKRRMPRHKIASIYMKPDANTQYVQTQEIDLSKVQSFITEYPRTDDLDGCFIGAFTTAEEDLILATLVLELGLKDSIGHLGSAATIAISSLDMRVIDPTYLLGVIDTENWHKPRRTRISNMTGTLTETEDYVEPSESSQPCCKIQDKLPNIRSTLIETSTGDLIDTDNAAREHCMQYTHPEFCDRVKEGFNIVVAGKAFGCGSSREQAVMALLGCGVKCVIFESFALILQHNVPNLGLLRITMLERLFHAAVEDGAEITNDFDDSIVDMDGHLFMFNLSPMDRELFCHGGIASAFRRVGSNLFEAMAKGKSMDLTPDHGFTKSADSHPELQCFPELHWTPPPKVEVKEYILISEDIDPPIPRFVVMHGLFYAIPPKITRVLPDDTEQDRNTKDHVTRSGWRFVPNLRGNSYIGPAPPLGHGAHRYIFTVVALSESLRFDHSQRVSQKQITKAMVGKVVGWGQWVGYFERPWPS